MIYSTPGRTRNIGLVSALYLISAVMNAGVTALIVWKLLRSRMKVTRLLNVPDNTMYTSVIGLLVESALPFTIIAIVAAVTNLPGLQMPISIYFGTLWAILAVSHIANPSTHDQVSPVCPKVLLPPADYLPCCPWKVIHGRRA